MLRHREDGSLNSLPCTAAAMTSSSLCADKTFITLWTMWSQSCKLLASHHSTHKTKTTCRKTYISHPCGWQLHRNTQPHCGSEVIKFHRDSQLAAGWSHTDKILWHIYNIFNFRLTINLAPIKGWSILKLTLTNSCKLWLNLPYPLPPPLGH